MTDGVVLVGMTDGGVDGQEMPQIQLETELVELPTYL